MVGWGMPGMQLAGPFEVGGIEPNKNVFADEEDVEFVAVLGPIPIRMLGTKEDLITEKLEEDAKTA